MQGGWLKLVGVEYSVKLDINIVAMEIVLLSTHAGWGQIVATPRRFHDRIKDHDYIKMYITITLFCREAIFNPSCQMSLELAIHCHHLQQGQVPALEE